MSRTYGHGRLTPASRHAFRANFRQPPAKKTSSSARYPTVALVRTLPLQSIAQFELQQVGRSITSGFRSVRTVDGGQGDDPTYTFLGPGVRRRRVCDRLGSGASHAGVDPRHWCR